MSAGDEQARQGIRPWKTLARRVLLSRPPWMEVGVERVELPSGRIVDDFLWVKSRDFVVVVAVTANGDVVLERSYKHGPRRVSTCLPGGYIEPDEAPLAAARRELREETGYEANDWRRVGSFTVDSNYGLNTEHVFLAIGARRVSEPGGLGHDDLEEIELRTLPLKSAIALLEEGEVAQLSSAAALAIAAIALSNAG